MPYILQTPAGEYVADIHIARDGEVKTSRAEAHVSNTLHEALAWRDVARLRGVECGIAGVTPYPLVRPDDVVDAGPAWAALIEDTAKRWDGRSA